MTADDRDNSVYIYSRAGAYDDQVILVILNLTPATIPGYQMKAPRCGVYEVLLNSDDLQYGGSQYWGSDEPRCFVTDPPNQREANTRYDALKERIRRTREQL